MQSHVIEKLFRERRDPVDRYVQERNGGISSELSRDQLRFQKKKQFILFSSLIVRHLLLEALLCLRYTSTCVESRRNIRYSRP